MLKKIKSHLAILLMLALAFTLLIPAPVQAASKKKPAKVTVTSVKTSGTNKVVVKWKKAKYATNYRIYWKQAGTKKWRTLATVKSNKTTYTHKSNNKARLVAGKKYVYTVRAYNKYGKKWGSYNTKGKTVMIPKKKAAPPATASVKPKPTTQTPAKPTATPVPVKPTEAPKPTATPVPAKPTEAPKPTATPTPVKVSSVTINPSTLKLTSKCQAAQLSASVLPNNAENKSIVWSTSNASVATVDNNGVVTALANGNTTITATTLDGSGKYAECSVVVEIPKENNQIIELAGGESKKIGITKSSFPEIIDFSKVTFDCKNAGITYEIGGFDYISTRAAVSIKALRKGNSVITASYENRVIARWTINVTSDWAEYIGYVNWRKQVESQIWTNGMSIKEKCDAAKNYIKTNFVYSTKTAAAVYAYNTCKGIDCFTATEFMGDFA
ncbi:Ig-like domain-containing protein, partial [Blautia obeum]